MHANGQGVGGFPGPESPEWLVSVRDLTEAKTASRFGVSIIDFKEPLNGPLAPVSADLWQAAADWKRDATGKGDDTGRHSRLRLSAALGEIDRACQCAGQVPAEFDFAKAGPAGCPSGARLLRAWTALGTRLPASTELVAVAYADHERAETLPPEQIVRLAAASGFKRILLDTYTKNGRSSIDILGTEQIARLGGLAARHRMWWSLAGSVDLEQLAAIEQWFPAPAARPDCIAVRGAVCGRDRTATLCPERLKVWQRRLASFRSSRTGLGDGPVNL